MNIAAVPITASAFISFGAASSRPLPIARASALAFCSR